MYIQAAEESGPHG
uniref:Uncharacterized protein n=1 Tax=Zea mays TaxID=4577 RepID=C4J1S2_MAIZE|nr:unknown [Zea mays]